MKLKPLQSIRSAHSAFSLVEIILASALFLLISSTVVGAVIYGQDASFLSAKRSRAIFLAEEGLEAVRNIRDENFSNLIDGTHGLSNLSNVWIFSGTADTVDEFERQITISIIDDTRKLITSRITWQQNLQRQGEIVLETYLTDWSAVTGNCATFCQELGYTQGTCRQNPNLCTVNNETYESDGDLYCEINPPADSCCCSNEVSTDTTPPSAVTDLAASNPTSNSIDLTWTAPGDDANTGTATAYDLRYATTLISGANWDTAIQATGEPTPATAGSSETFTVNNLLPNTTYYFAIKTSDEVNNWSALSNIANATTLVVYETCAEYCQSLNYTTGTCRINANQCRRNNETYESGGDAYCSADPQSDTCCCLP